MSAIEEQEVRGFTATLHYDPDPANPRSTFDNVGEFYGDASEWAEREVYYDGEPMRTWTSEGKTEALRDFATQHEADLVLPVRFVDYGYNAHVHVVKRIEEANGFYLVPATKVASEFTSRDQADRCARGEVETFDAFLSGEVYGWTVTDPAGKVVDSCWGYYGEPDYAMAEARSVAESAAREREERVAMLTERVEHAVDVNQALADMRELAALAR